MDKSLKIGCIQHSYKGSQEKTVKYLKNEICKSAEEGVKILCLQEMALNPYFCQEMKADNFDFALNEISSVFKEFKMLAKQYEMVLILPFFEKTISGLFFNSVLVIDADGEIIGKYRKSHIPEDPYFHEKYYFTEGDTGYKVFNTKYGKISVLICWDQWFPEAARIVSLMGAEIIFYPSAIGILKDETGFLNEFKDAWITVQRASAISNGVYVCSVNRTGSENNIDFWGSSFVCGPFGKILSGELSHQEGSVNAAIELALIQKTRITWPFFRDRRIDTYSPLLNRFVK